ncbi:hypothetical protein Trydic_g20076 [Trypoxylus dichotomus]
MRRDGLTREILTERLAMTTPSRLSDGSDHHPSATSAMLPPTPPFLPPPHLPAHPEAFLAHTTSRPGSLTSSDGSSDPRPETDGEKGLGSRMEVRNQLKLLLDS